MPKSNRKKKFYSTVKPEIEAVPENPREHERRQPGFTWARWFLAQRATLVSVGVIVATGLLAFSSGLLNPFMGDDIAQIVNNTPVHSISNFGSFFSGSTFYNGSGQNLGIYYRPLMTTVFSLIYTIFGADPFYFHLVQLSLHILGAIVLFLVFRYFFRPILASGLAMIFLVHPINSQAVFSIPALQEPLFFLFGILAFWVIVKFQDRSLWWMVLAAALLFLSLLSKESGILFIVATLGYVFIVGRKRFLLLLGCSAIGLTLYLALKIHAVGFLSTSHIAPIDDLGLWQRLLSIPSMAMFYLATFLAPIKLSQSYYWTNQTVTFTGFVLPLLALVFLAALAAFIAIRFKRKGMKREFVLFTYFASWAAIGMAIHMQIIPLDMTACETWFYFPIVGLLGMAGVLLDPLIAKVRPLWVIAAFGIVTCLFGYRTMARGGDWGDPVALAYLNIDASGRNYVSEYTISNTLAKDGEFEAAIVHARASVDQYPNYANYTSLGAAQFGLQDYAGARQSFMAALRYGGANGIASNYSNLAALTPYTGGVDENRQFIRGALEKFPKEPNLWFFLALLEDKHGDKAAAKAAISQAKNYGCAFPQFNEVYEGIMNGTPYEFKVDARPYS